MASPHWPAVARTPSARSWGCRALSCWDDRKTGQPQASTEVSGKGRTRAHTHCRAGCAGRCVGRSGCLATLAFGRGSLRRAAGGGQLVRVAGQPGHGVSISTTVTTLSNTRSRTTTPASRSMTAAVRVIGAPAPQRPPGRKGLDRAHRTGGGPDELASAVAVHSRNRRQSARTGRESRAGYLPPGDRSRGW